MKLAVGIGRSLRRYFIAGLLVWAPIYITYFVVHFIVNLLDGGLALLPQNYQPARLLGREIPGLGVFFYDSHFTFNRDDGDELYWSQTFRFLGKSRFPNTPPSQCTFGH